MASSSILHLSVTHLGPKCVKQLGSPWPRTITEPAGDAQGLGAPGKGARRREVGGCQIRETQDASSADSAGCEVSMGPTSAFPGKTSAPCSVGSQSPACSGPWNEGLAQGPSACQKEQEQPALVEGAGRSLF